VEVQSFLTVALAAHRQETGFEALSQELETAGVSSIGLYPPGSLDAVRLVSVGEDDIDGAGETALWTGQGVDSSEYDRLIGMLNEFADMLHDKEDGARMALDHVRDTDCLASVCRRLEGRMDDANARQAFEALFDVLHDASGLVQEQAPSLRQGLLEELSKAVEVMDAEMRKTFVHDRLRRDGPFAGRYGPYEPVER